MLDTKQVASLLGISVGYTSRLIARGYLKAVNVSPGGIRASWRVSLEEVEAFKERNRNVQNVPVEKAVGTC